MRKTINLCGIIFVLATGIVYAEAEFDFEDVDGGNRYTILITCRAILPTKMLHATIALAKEMQTSSSWSKVSLKREAMPLMP